MFGYDLADDQDILEEKLELFTRLLRDQPVTWSGKFRSPPSQPVPQPSASERATCPPGWARGSPQSVIRAARYGLPLTRAVIGGSPVRFAPLVDLYRRALDKFGYPQLRVGMPSTAMWPGPMRKPPRSSGHTGLTFSRAQLPSGDGRGPTRDRFQAEIDEGSLYLGSPETVATKIAWVIRLLGLSRFDLAYATGRVPHEQKMATIELYGREVIPRVKALLTEPRRPLIDPGLGRDARRSSEPKDRPVPSHHAADLRLGVVGAGKIGTVIARAAVEGGYDVAISGSGDVERIELIVEVLAPGARAVTTNDVVRYAPIVVLAVPMHRFRGPSKRSVCRQSPCRCDELLGGDRR